MLRLRWASAEGAAGIGVRQRTFLRQDRHQHIAPGTVALDHLHPQRVIHLPYLVFQATEVARQIRGELIDFPQPLVLLGGRDLDDDACMQLLDFPFERLTLLFQSANALAGI
jgi:hypothetical protein